VRSYDTGGSYKANQNRCPLPFDAIDAYLMQRSADYALMLRACCEPRGRGKNLEECALRCDMRCVDIGDAIVRAVRQCACVA